MRWLARLLLALLAGPAAACVPEGRVLRSGEVEMAWRVAGPPIVVGRMFALDATVCPPTARLRRVDATMPEHQHGMNYRPRLSDLGGGRWRAEGLMFHMAGRWELRFEVVDGAGRVLRLSEAVTVPPGTAVLDFSDEEKAVILGFGPWPPPGMRDAGNRVDGDAVAVALGRELFGDRGLSGARGIACAGCHRPDRAFQDGRPVARGRRNTPSLLDAAQRRWFGWDGASDSLWAASLKPLLAADEIAATPDALARHLRERPALRRRYEALFGPVQADERLPVHIAKVLAAYQATLVSPHSAFDDFRDALARGDGRAAARYPQAAQRGLRLFIGRGRCSLCHAGPAFSNGEFADIGRPFFVAGGVDSGRWGGLEQLLASRANRLGEWSDGGPDDARALATRQVLLEPRHFGEFRVPGLRQLTHTAPYMHDGSLATLEDVVRHYSELDEDRLHADGQSILRPLRLSRADAADLVAFLRSLSGPSAAPAGQRRRAASRRPRGSLRWPRHRGRHCGSARCRTAASGCLR